MRCGVSDRINQEERWPRICEREWKQRDETTMRSTSGAEVSRGLAFSTRFHLLPRLLSSYDYTVSRKYLEIYLLSRSHNFHSSRLYVNVGFFFVVTSSPECLPGLQPLVRTCNPVASLYEKRKSVKDILKIRANTHLFIYLRPPPSEPVNPAWIDKREENNDHGKCQSRIQCC